MIQQLNAPLYYPVQYGVAMIRWLNAPLYYPMECFQGQMKWDDNDHDNVDHKTKLRNAYINGVVDLREGEKNSDNEVYQALPLQLCKKNLT